MQITVLNFDVIDSTNLEAIREAKAGAHEGLCVVAGKQTAGRGRLGRTWVSEEGAGLYFSIVLRPRLDARNLTLVTLMSAVAVAEALDSFGISADIKWVNDIHVSGKKICGILSESTDTPAGLAVIVGIGINLRSDNFPPEIANLATSVEAETGSVPDPSSLTGELITHLTGWYQILCRDGGPERVRREWTRRSSYATGKLITVKTEVGSFQGITRGIEENGALRVELESGEIRIVQAGEVTAVRARE